MSLQNVFAFFGAMFGLLLVLCAGMFAFSSFVVGVDSKRLDALPFFRFLTTSGFRVTLICVFAIGVTLLAVSFSLFER